jgi:hypothetical protein
VLAKSKIKATCIGRQSAYDVPWTATANVTYQDQPAPQTVTLHGTQTGVTTKAIKLLRPGSPHAFVEKAKTEDIFASAEPAKVTIAF